ncbi:MAG: response regulator [Acetobacteraceae bacterium]
MADSLWIAGINIIPSILWCGIVLFCLIWLRDPIQGALRRISKLKGFGVEAEFIKEVLEQQAAKSVPAGDEKSRSSVAKRSERVADIAKGTKILLVNDMPDTMRAAVTMLERLGMKVTITTNSDSAVEQLRGSYFDAVISDMQRGGVPDEGLRFIQRTVKEGIRCPTILATGEYHPEMGTPAYAFGITNRLDELMHYVFDIVERYRL